MRSWCSALGLLRWHWRCSCSSAFRRLRCRAGSKAPWHIYSVKVGSREGSLFTVTAEFAPVHGPQRLGVGAAAMNEPRPSNPLVDNVDALRHFDSDHLSAARADWEVFKRVNDLLLTIAAIGELHDRHVDPTPPAVRAEIDAISLRDELAGDGFAVRRFDVQEIADGFRDRGDVARAETVERAWKWMVLMVMIAQTLS